MKKYPKYKDSGIQWIGQIPEHWKTLKLRWICNQIFTGRTPVYSTEPNDLLVFGQRNNQKYGIDFTGIKYADEAFFASRAESEFLSFGDVLLNTLGGGSVGRIGFYDKTDMQVITDGHVMILRTNDTCTQRYLYYSLWAQQTELEEAAVGSTNQAFLTTTQMTQWRITLPPLSEQQAIVEFLDKKTGQIDQSIALLETQKTDLQAYRQALITETVTKGLNPNTPMKDSGIQWLKEIPINWGICRIKDVVETKSGINLTTESVSKNGLYPVYGGNGIRGYYSSFSNEGDHILIGRQGALCGNINYASGQFWATEHAVVCYPKKPFVLKWLGELLRIMNLGQYSLSAAQPGLSMERIKMLSIPLPPLSEQQAIADYLDKKTSDIDAALKQMDTQITDLQAYRTALISEAVTGKIDVR